MRVRFLAIIGIVTLITTGFACSNPDIPAHNLRGYFWTTDDPGITHRLYIDKQFKGILPHLVSTSPGTQKLNIPLEPGTHDLLVTDNNGTVISKGEMELEFTRKNTNISISWNNGRCHVEVKHD